MIRKSDLKVWQAHVPWPRPSQIEQDLRLARGVAAIFSDPILREHLAMRGGTVLHKAQLAPAARYSEDIDLVLVGKGEVVRATSRSYDIDEMLGTKTRAPMQIEQGRDLFDLAHAWQLSLAGSTPYKVDGARPMEAFSWYLEKEGTSFTAEEANAHLDAKLKNKAFRSDMNTLLQPDMPRFDVDQAAETGRDAYFTHLK